MKKIAVIFLFAIFSCGKSSTKEIKIGTQTWTSINLDVSTFRNGETIRQAKTNAEWVAAGENAEPAWCYYNNDPANGKKYGKLYNWYAANDPRGLAPEGWHIPSSEDWEMLFDNTDDPDAKTGRGSGKKLKSNSGWKGEGNGTNESGFKALPGGVRLNNGSFIFIGESGGWWSSSANSNCAMYCYLVYESESADLDGTECDEEGNKQTGLSIRCIKNEK